MRPRSRAIAVVRAVVLAGVGALTTWHVLAPTGPAANGTYLAANIGGACLALVPVRGSRRSPWSWVAAGLGLSALAEVVYWSYTAVFDLPEPDVSWADVPWLASYVVVGIGATRLFHLRTIRRDYRDVDALLDMAAAAVVGLLVMWTLVIRPTVADGSTPMPIRALWSAYPVCDVALLTLVVGGALVNMRRRRPEQVVLSLGIVGWALSDAGYAIVGTEDVAAWMDAGWMIAAALIGLAAYEGRRATSIGDQLADAVALPSPRAGRVRLAIGMLPLLTASVIAVIAHERGTDIDPLAGAVATAALGLIAYVRCMRLVGSTEEAARELDASEHYYRALATNAADAVVVVDEGGRVLSDSPTFGRLVGIEAGSQGMSLMSRRSPLDRGAFADLLAKAAMLPGEVVEAEIRVHRADRAEQWLDVRAVDMLHDPVVAGYVVNLHDVTDRKRSEAELRTQAFHDALTGLANRALFRDRVEHALGARARTAIDPSVIFVDLDGFKYVNDSLGHETGDELLVEIARRLQAAVRPGDTVARLGGDEFAVLLESAEAKADGPTIAARILDVVRQPMTIKGRTLLVSCSAGVAIADATSDSSTLLSHADMAMYEAKARGKARWAVYDPSMGDAARERLILEADLHHALAAGQFELEYQPIVAIADGSLAGFESLLRWRHPTLGTVSPDRFIPILEENGRIVEVGAWVLETACRTLAAWSAEAPQHQRLTMSVNVSSVQLSDPAFVDTVQHALSTSGLAPHQLVLEVTETALVNDTERAAATLQRMHDLGTRLAIDDFGTGYSSLSYLRQFPVDVLKIDRSFIQSIEPDGPLPTIVKGVLELSHTLGIEAVAEGIEEAHQLARLGDQSCEKGQGYFFARPLPATQALEFLRSHAIATNPAPTGTTAPG